MSLSQISEALSILSLSIINSNSFPSKSISFIHNCLKFWMILFTDAIKQKDLNEFDFLYNIDIYKLININKIVFNTLKNVTTNVNMELLMDEFVLEVEKIL